MSDPRHEPSRILRLGHWLLVATPVHLLVMVLGFYRLLWPELMARTVLDEGAYEGPVLLAAVPGHGRLMILLAVVLGPLIIGWRRIAWAAIDPGRRTRLFVLALAAIFAWVLTTAAPNLYFDQVYALDRIALLALTALILVHPTFAVAQLFLVLILLGQLMFPLPDAHWHWPDKRLPIDCLILFVGYLYVRLLARPRPGLYLAGVWVLAGATYVTAAVEKMRLGPWPWSWPLDNRLSNLFVSAHTNGGWLREMSDDGIARVGAVLSRLDPAMGVATLLLELSPLLFLAHRRAMLWLPIGLIGLHLAIVASSGIFFWKWILLHAALIAYAGLLWRDADPGGTGSEAAARRLFGLRLRYLIALTVPMMLWGGRLFQLVPFVWADSRVANFFVLRAVGESGASYRLDPRFFAPYDLTVQQSRFGFLIDEPVLTGTYGALASWQLAQRLEATDLHGLDEVRRTFGETGRSPGRAERFERFVARSVDAAQHRGGRRRWWTRLAPPFHFQTTLAADTYAFEEPLSRVEVTFEEWFWDGRTLRRTRQIPALVVPLASREPRARAPRGAESSPGMPSGRPEVGILLPRESGSVRRASWIRLQPMVAETTHRGLLVRPSMRRTGGGSRPADRRFSAGDLPSGGARCCPVVMTGATERISVPLAARVPGGYEGGSHDVPSLPFSALGSAFSRGIGRARSGSPNRAIAHDRPGPLP